MTSIGEGAPVASFWCTTGAICSAFDTICVKFVEDWNVSGCTILDAVYASSCGVNVCVVYAGGLPKLSEYGGGGGAPMNNK